jgi:hypothetical protein
MGAVGPVAGSAAFGGNRVRVEPASLSELQALVTLGQVCHTESRFATLPYDAARVRERFVRMITQPLSTTFFVQAAPVQSQAFKGDDRQICGLMIGSIDEYFFCDHRVASSVFLLVHPSYRGSLAAVKMVMAFKAWAKLRHASEVYIGVASGVNMQRTGRFLSRMGLSLSGGNYSAWLPAASPSASTANASSSGIAAAVAVASD